MLFWDGALRFALRAVYLRGVFAQLLQQAFGNSTFVRTFMANSGVWHRVRRRRVALPICEGDFGELRMVSRRMSLEEATKESHVLAWHRRSWELLSCVACNCLTGAGGPLVPGKWSAVEERWPLQFQLP